MLEIPCQFDKILSRIETELSFSPLNIK